MDYQDERLLTMAAPEDRPEIAKLRDDITIPTALVQQARAPPAAVGRALPCRSGAQRSGALGADGPCRQSLARGHAWACKRMAHAAGLPCRLRGEVRASVHPPNTTARADCARAQNRRTLDSLEDQQATVCQAAMGK